MKLKCCGTLKSGEHFVMLVDEFHFLTDIVMQHAPRSSLVVLSGPVSDRN